MTSTERVDRAQAVQRSRRRSAEQQQAIVAAARRLVEARGGAFTTQELIAEAGIALQTFYRYFGGKDELLLAVLEDTIAEAAVALAGAVGDEADPEARLRFYITWMARAVGTTSSGEAQFVTSEHWRLHQIFPEEIARASQPIVDLFAGELAAATATGQLHSTDPQRDAWFAMRLVMSVFHHYAFVASDEHAATVAEDLWAFCLTGFGGR